MIKHWILALFVAVSGSALSVGEAEAKRLGGSKSIGMQRQVAPTAPKAPAASPQQAAPNQAVKPATPAAQPAAAQSGWRKWMGPLAGLAAGIGLAALLSHLGLGGEFAGLLLAILAVVAVIFLLRRFMGGRSQAATREPAYAGGVSPLQAPVAREAIHAPAHGATPAQAPAETGQARIPADFDAAGFAHQAKVNFVRLQAANDACNLDDIREFTTPEMFAEIKLAIDERGCTLQKTDVIQLDAEVLEVVEEAKRYVVSVRFNGLLREEADSAPQAFDEVWHLSKPTDGSRGWALAGIQQLN